MAHANLTPADVRRYLHPEPDTGAIVDAVMKALGIDDESVRDTVNQAVRGVLLDTATPNPAAVERKIHTSNPKRS